MSVARIFGVYTATGSVRGLFSQLDPEQANPGGGGYASRADAGFALRNPGRYRQVSQWQKQPSSLHLEGRYPEL
jgi:hypothetical protein